VQHLGRLLTRLWTIINSDHPGGRKPLLVNRLNRTFAGASFRLARPSREFANFYDR
jgi:hypothetical protein